jgi:hypothetical protein
LGSRSRQAFYRLLMRSIFEEMIPEIDGDDDAGFEEVILH